MSIAGIGTDLIEVARIGGVLQRFGERFARRILTDFELAQWQRRDRSERFLAKRFAAKEAAVKALGTGIAQGVCWHDMEIRNDALGRPELEFGGGAEARCRVLGVRNVHLSITDERDYALAFVVLEGS